MSDVPIVPASNLPDAHAAPPVFRELTLALQDQRSRRFALGPDQGGNRSAFIWRQLASRHRGQDDA
jgi:hypothetical protein